MTNGKPSFQDKLRKATEQQEKDFLNMLENMTEFQYLFFLDAFDKESKVFIKEAFKFFLHSDILFVPKEQKIMLVGTGDPVFIDEATFCQIEDKICSLHWLESSMMATSEDSEEVRKIKAKLQQGRKIVNQLKQRSSDKISDIGFFDLIGSMSIKLFNLNIFNIWDISYYYFYDQLKRMNILNEFDMNIQARLAGAKIKSPIKSWIQSVDKN